MATSPPRPSEVYILDCAVDDYAQLGIVDRDDLDRFEPLDGSPMLAGWRPVRLFWDTVGGSRPIPDVTIASAHVFNRRALDALSDLLEGRGELLPLDVEGSGEYYAFNCTRFTDAFDEAASEFEYLPSGSGFLTVDRYVFDRDRLADETIFKLRQDPRYGEYVTDVFRRRVEAAGLVGFVWDRRVWSAPERAGRVSLASAQVGRAGDVAQVEEVGRADELVAHVEGHVGPVKRVFSELVPGDPPVDLLLVAPDAGRSVWTVVSSGMSARPMSPPPRRSAERFAELCLCLPGDWTLDEEALFEQSAYWPLRLLKWLARLPHEHRTWLWAGHTVPNGDPPEPWAPNTGLSGALLAAPALGGEGFGRLAAGEHAVQLLAVVAVHADELAFGLRWGGGSLAALLRMHRVSELVDPARASVLTVSPAGEEGLHGLEVCRIVPAFEPAGETDDLAQAQALLHGYGVGPDDSENGVVLPPREVEALYTPRYYGELRRRLEGPADREGIATALAAIRDELQVAVFPN